MKNAELIISKDGILTIMVDLRKSFGKSKSGKSVIISSTEGNVRLPDPNNSIKIGLNVYKSISGIDG